MPLTLYRRAGTWWFRGKIDRLPGSRYYRQSTGASEEGAAREIAAEFERRQLKGHYAGHAQALTFAEAILLYDATPQMARFLEILIGRDPAFAGLACAEITGQTVKAMAPRVYPRASTDTWQRQVCTPVSAVIDTAHELGRCPPIRIRAFSTRERVAQGLRRGTDSRVEKTPGSWPWLEAFRAQAFRMHPYHPNHYFAYAAFAHFFTRDLDTALAMGAKADAAPWVDAAAFTASALAHAGRMGEARAELAQFHADFHDKIAVGRHVEAGEPIRWVVQMNPFRRAEDLTYFVDGLESLGEANTSAPLHLDAQATARLARTGAGWIADFAGERAAFPDLKGVHDLRRLLERPGEEVHCLDLTGRSETAYGSDAALDDRARAALKARIRDLGEDLAEAEDMNDIGRAERARSEMDALVETLSRALGLGGRGRRLGDMAERARTTVTWRLRYALRKVAEVHPALGRHLAASVRSGAFCVYRSYARIWVTAS